MTRRDTIQHPMGSGRGGISGVLFSCFLFLFVFGLLFSGSTVWAQGYSIRGQKVVVHTKNHWEAWTFPKGVVEIGDDGQVEPRFLRKNINACLDADGFVHEIDKRQQQEFIQSWHESAARMYLTRGGIKRAGSKERDAAYIIDGREETFWGPNLDDPPQDWWVEIDLGRLVSATKFVVRFAKEGEGDPFLQFKVLTSTGQRAFETGTAMQYVIAGETVKPNKKQRVFEFELSPVLQADAGWSGGRVFQYVRVVMTDSDLDKAERLTKERYDTLLPEERGAVEYVWRIAGEERLVDPAEYEKLSAEEQGEIRYYRKEQPKLAEIEVWAVGDNISLGLLDRGGGVYDFYKPAVPINAFDGLYTTWWDALRYRETGTSARGGMIKVDLGALFWVDTIHLVVNKSTKEYKPGELRGYLTRVSDGSRAPEAGEGAGTGEPEIYRNLIWGTVSPESRQILEDVLFYLDDTFSPRKVRYVEFRHIDILRGHEGLPTWETGRVGEFQIYGEGYVAEVTMTSELIELGGSRNITSIEWDADVPPGTQVELRTRTGDELREVKHYFDKSGTELTELKYNSLPSFSKGPITTSFLPGGDWSTWSVAYTQSGDAVTSPSPRKYLMIQVRLLSDDPYAAATLRSIAIHFRNPVAQQVVGEISPNKEVPGGRSQDFDLFIKPTFISANPGFDDILIEAPPGVDMNLLEVSLGKEEDFLTGTTKDFLPDQDGVFRSEDGRRLEVLKDRSDSLWVRLPEPVKMGNADLLCIRFQSILFLNGTVFLSSVGRASVSGSWQRVDPGDATGKLAPGRGLTVFVSTGERIIGNVEIGPNPFTPNGDGTNDEVVFAFSVFKANVPRTVEVVLYDLDGRRLRTLSERRVSAAGRYVLRWDGKDESGDMVFPGLYLAHIYVGADSDVAERRAAYAVYVAY